MLETENLTNFYRTLLTVCTKWFLLYFVWNLTEGPNRDLWKGRAICMKNEVLTALQNRRSCRSYEDRQPDPAALEAVVNAALWAPSGMGRQSTVIVVVQDPATVRKLSAMNAAVMGRDGDPFYGAPCVAVVLVDRTVSTCVEDGSLAMGNLLNAAESVGLSGCWIHRAREMFDSHEGKALLNEWGVPNAENLMGVGNCILGYAAPGGKKPAAPRREGRVVYVK